MLPHSRYSLSALALFALGGALAFAQQPPVTTLPESQRQAIESLGTKVDVMFAPDGSLKQVVVLEENELTAEDFSALGKLTTLPRLTFLSYEKVKDEDLVHLRPLTALETLSLNDSP